MVGSPVEGGDCGGRPVGDGVVVDCSIDEGTVDYCGVGNFTRYFCACGGAQINHVSLWDERVDYTAVSDSGILESTVDFSAGCGGSIED